MNWGIIKGLVFVQTHNPIVEKLFFSPHWIKMSDPQPEALKFAVLNLKKWYQGKTYRKAEPLSLPWLFNLQPWFLTLDHPWSSSYEDNKALVAGP